MSFMSEFHFIEPLWFLAMIPLGLLLWLGWRAEAGVSAWRRVIDPRLLRVLTIGSAGPGSRLPLMLLAVGWLIAVVALANPTFERQPVPAFRSDAARVVVLDLSRSMLAADLSPSRLERARYKIADILSRSADGQVGLVVYAGDAFAVSPLTDDAETIRAMLEALSPQIMPVQGSRPDRGIELGLDLLRQAGARNGEIILLTDDAGGASALAMAEQLTDAGHALAVIGVGTAEGAPVPGVTTSTGPVMSRLDIPALEQLADAGAGRYATLSSSDHDLDQVLNDPSARPRALAEADPLLAERWNELGPWVAVLLLPLAALAFRRGWLMALLLVLGPGTLMLPQPAWAFGWPDLWQRQDQQAAQAFAAGELEQARALAKAPARAGSAAYRLGDYQDAAARFGAGDAAVDHYNRANALARSGELEAALAAYDEALARDPTLADAAYNREQVEAALREQAQQPHQPHQPDADSAADQQDGQPGSDGRSAADQASADQPASESAAESQASPSAAGSDTTGDPTGADDSKGANASQDPTPPADETAAERSARTEQAAADYQDEAASAQSAQGDAARDQVSADSQEPSLADASATLDTEQREARQAADQWLRRIPDDPAELLRRKFLYQYQTRQGATDLPASGQPW
ncbi:MAG: VWA domain-containing protein [Lamprobacter sp.]|uniref:VWA domain-containing protein n=1 Tax=Lamprobacter sp. TaxID=3100796 RepID=UPI002B264355|nr:VWA domain-containing protein [Lamprobacter sp.]MEA3641621.1 VWA domain-containing protein [Lamprobacter sp.]